MEICWGNGFRLEHAPWWNSSIQAWSDQWVILVLHLSCKLEPRYNMVKYIMVFDAVQQWQSRDHSGYGLGQWEKVLLCNTFSYWLSPCPEWSLQRLSICLNSRQKNVSHTFLIIGFELSLETVYICLFWNMNEKIHHRNMCLLRYCEMSILQMSWELVCHSMCKGLSWSKSEEFTTLVPNKWQVTTWTNDDPV